MAAASSLEPSIGLKEELKGRLQMSVRESAEEGPHLARIDS